MAHKSLAQFLRLLDAEGQLLRIKEFVDPVLEIAEVTDRISKQPGGGKALLFENTGTDFPVVTNLFGSHKRMCMVLGVGRLDEVSMGIQTLFRALTQPRDGFLGKLQSLPALGRLATWLPVVVSGKGVCQQVVALNPDLSMLPILKCWPYDGGRFVTLPMVNTKDPVTGIRNMGMYRMQVFGSSETGMHWHQHKTGARHYREYQKLGRLMPVAVALGGDPVYTYSATAPLPDNFDEYILAGYLRKKRVRLVKCITVDLEVPEDVDFVIEGYVDPSEELSWEGPFGDHTGFYSLADWYPKFHVTCVTHRKDAIYPATIVGVPPMEDAYIAKATERIFLEPMRIAMAPELEDINLPVEGVAHNVAVVRIQSSYKGQAYKVMSSLWGAGQMMFNKILVAVDGEGNIHDYPQLLRQIIENTNPRKDLFFGKGPLDVLDHASAEPYFGSKLFIDATHKPDHVQSIGLSFDVESILEEVSQHIREITATNVHLVRNGIPVLIIAVNKRKGVPVRELFYKLFRLQSVRDVRVVIAVDAELDVADLSLVMWYALGNFDPQRDTYLVEFPGNSTKYVAFDGTQKLPPYDNMDRECPSIVRMDAKTIQRVDSRWPSYGIGPLVGSPSVRFEKFSNANGPVVSINYPKE